MEKTKEQILKESMSKKYCGETYFDFLDKEEKPLIYNAMQEYADQEKEKEAIEFVKWMSYLMESNYQGKENWYCNDGKIRTTKELYQIFKKEQHGK